MKRAIIDIGTNTAHILIGEVSIIGEVSNYSLDRIIFKKRCYTFLGDDGLETIGDAAIGRLKSALDQFEESTKMHSCAEVSIVATEGLRAASNSEDIIAMIESNYGWPVTIISGETESLFIYKGAVQSVDMRSGAYLIMDIGGGSVEFILSIDGRVDWQKSYPIGISRLYMKFHQRDPIGTSDIIEMNQYLDQVLIDLWSLLDDRQLSPQLVGCAGTFEVFLSGEELADMSVAKKAISTARLSQLLDLVLHKDQGDRSIVKGVPPERAKYIVVALTLIDYVVRRFNVDSFLVSKYALKEGAIISNDIF